MADNPSTLSNIPRSLQQIDSWIAMHRIGDDKVPIRMDIFDKNPNVRLKWKKPSNWKTFEEVKKWVDKRVDVFPAFVLTENQGLIFIDFDDVCSTPYQIPDELLDLVKASSTYAEFSMSGTGFHIFGKCPDKEWSQHGALEGENMEIYSKGRLCAFTGRKIPESQDDINEISLDVFSQLLQRCDVGNQDSVKTTEPIKKIIGFELEGEIPPGKKQYLNLFRLSMNMIKSGFFDAGQIKQHILNQNQLHCDPPYDEKTLIGKLWNTIDEYIENNPPIDKEFKELYNVSDKGTPMINRIAIADHLHRRFSTISFKGSVYIYDEGIYRLNEGDLECEIKRIFDGIRYSGKIQPETTDLIFRLSSLNPQHEYPFRGSRNKIPVSNGVVTIDFEHETVDLESHSPENMFDMKYPIVYDKHASGQALREQVLEHYLKNETDSKGDIVNMTDILYQIPAQALLQQVHRKPYKKSYILLGGTDSGKTTYQELLDATFCGTDLHNRKSNISKVSLQNICSNHFNADLEGKILNCPDELASIELDDDTAFKMFTGGIFHRIERKFHEAYEGYVNSVHVFTCNDLPKLSEEIIVDDAFWGRWEILIFFNVFTRDVTFNEKWFTQENISGYFNDILDMMIRINKHGLVKDSTQSNIKRAWKYGNNPFRRFIDEHFVETDERIPYPKELILLKYQQYCHDKGMKAENIPDTVNKLIKLVVRCGFRDDRTTIMGKTRHTWSSFSKTKEDSVYHITEEEITDALAIRDNKEKEKVSNT